MELTQIELLLNTSSFKYKVESLFSQALRDDIDFDFSIAVKKLDSGQIEVKAYDTSYDCDGMGIPSLIALLSINPIVIIEQEVLNQFKVAINSLET